jgi:hypothetical protein
MTAHSHLNQKDTFFMNSITKIAAAASAVMAAAVATTAHSAPVTFDFAAIAAADYAEVGRERQADNTYTVDGVTMEIVTSSGDWAWLDSQSSRGAPSAGLGVLARGIDGARNGQDGIGGADALDELIGFFFTQEMILTDLVLRTTPACFATRVKGDGCTDHTLYGEGTARINGGDTLFAEGRPLVLPSEASHEWTLEGGLEGPWSEGFYVSSATFDVAPIPLPAAAWMLMAGLGGLAGWKRWA